VILEAALELSSHFGEGWFGDRAPTAMNLLVITNVRAIREDDGRRMEIPAYLEEAFSSGASKKM
jgi:hypothetical protein